MATEYRYTLSGLTADELNTELDRLWSEARADPSVLKHLEALGEDPTLLQGIDRRQIIEVKRDESGLEPFSVTIIVALLERFGEKAAFYLWEKVILPWLKHDKGAVIDQIQRRL